MNKNIIIVILVIVIIAILGVVMFSQPTTTDGKLNTQINFLSESTLKNGDIIQFELKDAQGNAVSNQAVNITFEENGQNQIYTVVTDNNGKAGLELNNEATGSHDVTVNYEGNEKYNACTGKQTINIEDGTSTEKQTVSDNSTASTVKYNNATSSSQSSSNASQGSESKLYYDKELDVWYDSDGIIRGGQNDGQPINYIINNPPIVTENGLE